MLPWKPIFVLIITYFVTASPTRDLDVGYGYACSIYSKYSSLSTHKTRPVPSGHPVDAPIEIFDSSYAVATFLVPCIIFRPADLIRRRGRRARSSTNTHQLRNIWPGSVLIQMTSSSWLIDIPPLSATPSLTSPPHRRHRADRDTTRASSHLAQMPKPRRHRPISPVLIIRHSFLRRLLLGLGSGHYRTRSLVSSTYSTTVLLASGHRHKPSPSTLTRGQRTFGYPQSAATAMAVNSMRFKVQLIARLIGISPLPMWVVCYSTRERCSS
jgi:hypothetical protein